MSLTGNADSAGAAALPVGIVSDGARLPALARAVRDSGWLRLAVQSGMRLDAALPDVPRVDDARQMIGSGEVQALLLDAATRDVVETCALAAERGVHVWQRPPLALRFADALECARRMRKHEFVHRVASWWDHVVADVWHDLPWPEPFVPRISETRISAAAPPRESWLHDPTVAAGGVLAADGYAGIEALLAVRGMPQSVFAVTDAFRAPPSAPRTTEDTAVVVMRYDNGGVAWLRAAWDGGQQRVTEHHAARFSVTLADHTLTLRGAAGVLEQRAIPGGFLAADLNRFVEWIRAGARDRAAAAAERHIAVSAVLEAAYLSARTGQPESPMKNYEVQGWPAPAF